METPRHDTPEPLWDLIDTIRFAMFTTRHADGRLRSRPMTIQNGKDEHGAELWFFLSRAGEPMADVRGDPEVNVAFADMGKDRYVSVSGTARAVDDPALKEKLWSTMAQSWFPGGPADPDLALVQVTISHAEYWDVKESKMVQMFKMARAAVTGNPPSQLGKHGDASVH